MEYRMIRAKFNSHCGECGNLLAKGDEIFWRKGSKALCYPCGSRKDKPAREDSHLDDMYDRGFLYGERGM